MARLFIVGDSFSSVEDTRHGVQGITENNCWTKILADKLNVEKIFNNSLLGSNQDFAWFSLHNWLTDIRPDDYMLVLLTHPGRYWFFQERPCLSKIDLLPGLESEIGHARCQAARDYVRYIQRPQLDGQWLLDKLGWLAYTQHLYNLKHVLVVQAFDQYVDLDGKFPHLNISKGNLNDHISIEEVGYGATNEEYLSVIALRDPRYNHMCLRNHKILAERIHHSLTTNSTLDLTSLDFHKGFLSKDAIADPNFQASDLCPAGVERYYQDHAKGRSFLALKKLVGLSS